ncbi:MAG: tRNA (guanosine(46)-N7)-methyltransferase TrmB [Pseudomonadales bacterium]|nr:tRNA (guanosine(46)-N7)-methyltransferase TrmB [Pseudomonadales bacterium]
MDATGIQHKRAIRSYVIREGRMTPGQTRALETQWQHYGLDVTESPVDIQAIFPVSQYTVLEIGFGMGDSLFEMAVEHPDYNYLGAEVHRPGVGHLLHRAADAGLQNLRVFNADSLDVLSRAIPEGSLDQVQIFFPDPWHKKKHHKRRLINEAFLALLKSRLKAGGLIHIATDWAPYAEVIEALLAQDPMLQSEPPPARPVTKYEKRGVRLGHQVFDLAARYKAAI